MEASKAKFKKVLILSTSLGAGHLRAAEALEKTFHEMIAAAEVKNIDTLLDDPNRIKQMQKNVLRLALPQAAQTIVKKLLKLNPG
jgi:UDP-N-acetylglucosamine:LPS N-acetylglucosamine transferase